MVTDMEFKIITLLLLYIFTLIVQSFAAISFRGATTTTQTLTSSYNAVREKSDEVCQICSNFRITTRTRVIDCETAGDWCMYSKESSSCTKLNDLKNPCEWSEWTEGYGSCSYSTASRIKTHYQENQNSFGTCNDHLKRINSTCRIKVTCFEETDQQKPSIMCTDCSDCNGTCSTTTQQSSCNISLHSSGRDSDTFKITKIQSIQKRKDTLCDEWSMWDWMTCKGRKVRHRKRSCQPPSKYSVKSSCHTSESQYLKCKNGYSQKRDTYNTANEFCNWNSWGPCSKSCEVGTQIQNRSTCLLSFNNTSVCNMSTTQMDSACSELPLEQINNWSGWSNTSSGYITRTHTSPCNSTSFNCVRLEQEDIKTKKCNNLRCPVNGHWSKWGEWSSCKNCSGNCNTGTMTCARIKICNDPEPEYGGEECKGSSVELKDFSCQLQTCLESDAGLSVAPPVVGSIGAIIIVAVIVCLLIVIIKRRQKTKLKRNPLRDNSEMDSINSAKKNDATYDQLSKRQSQHIYGTINENILDDAGHEYSSVYDCTKEQNARDSANDNYFVLEAEKTKDISPSNYDETGNNYFILEEKQNNIEKRPNQQQRGNLDHEQPGSSDYFGIESESRDATCSVPKESDDYFILDDKHQHNDIKYTQDQQNSETLNHKQQLEDTTYFTLESDKKGENLDITEIHENHENCKGNESRNLNGVKADNENSKLQHNQKMQQQETQPRIEDTSENDVKRDYFVLESVQKDDKPVDDPYFILENKTE